MQSVITRFLPVLTCIALGGLLGGCVSAPYSPAPPAGEAPAATRLPGQAQASGGGQKTTPSRKGGGYYLDDGPDDSIPVDLASVPDAVPRVEPLRDASNRPYTALGSSYTPLRSVQPFSQTGIGSWYGKKFHGAKTSSGERYDMYSMTAAHPTLPIPSYARVTNLANGRSVIVRVNDRGPFLHSRIIDLSYVAAWKLGYINQGSAKLQVDAIVPDELGSFLAEQSTATPPPAATAPPMQAGATPSRSETTAADSGVSGVFLQLGAFNSAVNADNFREYLQNELKWLQQEIHTEVAGDRYRLRVGPFRDVDEARSVSDRIASRIRVQPFLVQR